MLFFAKKGNLQMRFIWCGTAILALALSVSGAAQKAAKQPDANKVVGTGEKADQGAAAPAANTPPPKGTTLDASAIPVIKNLSLANDPTAAGEAVKHLSEKLTSYDDCVIALTNALVKDPTKDPIAMAVTAQPTKKSLAPTVLIHYVNPGAFDAPTKTFPALKDNWYIWRRGISAADFDGTRLYGIKKVYVLSVVGPFEKEADINAGQDLSKMQYFAVIQKKLPENWNNFLGLFQIAGYVQNLFAGQGRGVPPFLYGFGTLQDMAVPANLTVTGYLPNSDGKTYVPVGKADALLNEGLHFWDAGVGVPVTKVKDLQYNQTTTGLQPAQVDKSSIFGLVNFYFRPLNLQDPGNSWHPSLTAGFALQGQVRDRLFAGITTNFPGIRGVKFTKSTWYQLLQPYVGVEFLSTQRPVSNPAPGASQLELHTVRKLAIGLEIPVKTAIQRLNSSQKTTPSNQTPSNALTNPPAPAATNQPSQANNQ
jgi:hypothetical protein